MRYVQRVRNPPSKLAILRATEAFCLAHGVDALSLGSVARTIDASAAELSAVFHDEVELLDAVLERHQTPYETRWESIFHTIETPRAAMHLLVETLASQVEDADGGAAYIAICAQMCASARFTLTGRPATTTPTALKLIGKLNAHSKVPFVIAPTRFDRFAATLFTSIYAWHRHGSVRLPKDVFVEDLVDCLEFVSLGVPSAVAQRAIDQWT